VELSHQSIIGRDFELNRRGYDPDMVDAHLAEIAAAVTERAARLAELEELVESLQAKVQDADDSQEALRLTLKAAAHAKEELLANAREQAKTMENEAAARAESLVADAEARVAELAEASEARAKSMEEGARARAGEVGKAALAESEALVARIEDLRTRLETAESALGALQIEVSPHVAAARAALEIALTRARESAEDPSILAALAPAAEPIAAASLPTEEPETEQHEVDEQPDGAFAEGFQQGTPDVPAQLEGQGDQPREEEASEDGHDVDESAEEHVTPEVDPVAQSEGPAEFGETESSADEEQGPLAEEWTGGEPVVPGDHGTDDVGEVERFAAEAAPGQVDDNVGPHLEVVDPGEPAAESGDSAADISDKVDRLLEELREVT